MRKATAISAGLHAAVLLWAMVSFSGKTLRGDAGGIAAGRSGQRERLLPNDQRREGRAQGRKAEAAGREKSGGAAEAGRGAQAEGHREERNPGRRRKQRRRRSRSRHKPDPIAEKIKQRAGTETQTKARAQPLPPKKPPQKPQPKFDADKIAALLDKRDPQRTRRDRRSRPMPTPSLGTATGMAAQLSQSEIDALRARLMALWNPPVGIAGRQRTQSSIPSGQVPPRRHGWRAAIARVAGSSGRAMASRATARVRAVLAGQPYTTCSSPSTMRTGKKSNSPSTPKICSAANQSSMEMIPGHYILQSFR